MTMPPPTPRSPLMSPATNPDVIVATRTRLTDAGYRRLKACARGGIRTHMVFRPDPFKGPAETNFTTRALIQDSRRRQSWTLQR